jgi:hypothetical protein
VEYEDIGSGNQKARKLVAYFKETGVKPLVLNLINSDAISTIAGTDDYTAWRGHRIQLVPAKTTFQGRAVPCIRVQPPPNTDKRPGRGAPSSSVLENELEDNMSF